MFDEHRHIYFGFHGCEKALAKDVLLNRIGMTPSKNLYDWLGNGVYFWENDPIRAFEFAKEVKRCQEPFVVGAILDLGYCLDLTCRASADRLVPIWENIVRQAYEEGGIKSNKPGRQGENGELLLRYLIVILLRPCIAITRIWDMKNTIRFGLHFGKEMNSIQPPDLGRKTISRFVSVTWTAF